jgi:hypothetical protein
MYIEERLGLILGKRDCPSRSVIETTYEASKTLKKIPDMPLIS